MHVVCLMGECCVVSGHWLDHSVLSKLKDLFKVSSRVRWVENLRPLCGGGTSKLQLAPAHKAKNKPKTHLSKERIKLWFSKKVQKLVQQIQKPNFKALKWLMSTFTQLSEEHTLCGGGTSKLQLLEYRMDTHHQGF